MEISVKAVDVGDIRSWREMYRLEMGCQIIHDSIHDRDGWTQEYFLAAGPSTIGYGSVATAGPWRGQPTVYEFYVIPRHRVRVFDLFQTLLQVSGARFIEVQSNDALGASMLYAFARDVKSESILFRDAMTTAHRPGGVVFRTPLVDELPDVPTENLRWHGAIEMAGQLAATGGILFHYNRPYGDIYMEVKEPFRRRGIGSFLVQELKRICYEGGCIPGARCSPDNIASRRTLQKAGFVPCGHLLTGRVPHVDLKDRLTKQ